MYVEKDKDGKIIIQNVSQEEADLLDDCICSYLAGADLVINNAGPILRKLKVELEKYIKDVY